MIGQVYKSVWEAEVQLRHAANNLGTVLYLIYRPHITPLYMLLELTVIR